MKNFKTFILCFSGQHLKYNSLLSTNNTKTYRADNGDILTVCGSKIGNSYTVEIHSHNGTMNYVTVKSRRGVYAVLTYYELLYNRDEVEFLNNQYGSLQHYFDDVCCTTEYIKERYY